MPPPTRKLPSPVRFRLIRSAQNDPRDRRVRHPLSPRNAREGDPRRPQASPSLAEELFPEQAKQATLQRSVRPPRVVPRYVANAPVPVPDQTSSFEHRRTVFPDLRDEAAVLEFRNASRTLCESDFRRLIPRGRHIEDWSRQGQIQKVIFGRRRITLERENWYYLTFDTPASARAYQENVARVFKLAKQYTPKSLFSPIPPAPQPGQDGNDVHSLVRKFSLAPLSQGLRLQLRTEHSPSLKRVFQLGGYPFLRDNEHPKVLLQFDGAMPALHDLTGAIYRHGSDRGVHWSLAGGTPVRRLQKRVRDKRSMPSDWEDENGDSGSEAIRGGEHLGGYGTGNGDHARDHAEGDEHLEDLNRWIVSFTSQAEAHRFARSWHKRRVPMPSGAEGDEAPVVHVEVV